MTNRDEHALQRSVVDLLTRVLPADAVWTAIAPLPGRDAKTGAQAKRLGQRAGLPDLLVIHKGFSLWIELKARLGQLSPAQRQMHENLKRAYCGYWNVESTGAVVVCRSVEDVIGQLNTYGMTKLRR